MLRQFLVGGAVVLVTIAIHALVTTKVVAFVESGGHRKPTFPSVFLIGVMVSTVSILMLAHFAEVLLWALVYVIVGATPGDSGNLYFAFVNYTTLGYGDIIPLEAWRLLGPITAMDGVLLFGWSTAVIVAILRSAMKIVHPEIRD